MVAMIVGIVGLAAYIIVEAGPNKLLRKDCLNQKKIIGFRLPKMLVLT